MSCFPCSLTCKKQEKKLNCKTTNGEEMHTTYWGKEGNPVALLIHGLASSSAAWATLAPHLAEKGYYVIAPDLPGHGQTFRQPTYNIENMAAEVINTHHLQKVDLIIGHSLGGLITAILTTHWKPRKTVLIDPVLWLPPTKLLQHTTRYFFKATVQDKYRFHHHTRPQWKKEIFHQELENYKLWDHKSHIALETRPHIMRTMLANGTGDDILVIRAKGSTITPARTQKQYANRIQYHYLADAGHNIALEQPQKLYKILEPFIGELPKIEQQNKWKTLVNKIRTWNL